MPTAQDFYNSLIKNPDYQGTLELSREQVVEREALRRMRQHRNNELALSMAAPISAMEKLALYLTKAEIEWDYENTPEGEKFATYLNAVADVLDTGYRPSPRSKYSPLKALELSFVDPTGYRWGMESEGTRTGWVHFQDTLADYLTEHQGVLKGGPGEPGFEMPEPTNHEVNPQSPSSVRANHKLDYKTNKTTAWDSAYGDYIETATQDAINDFTDKKGSPLTPAEEVKAKTFAVYKMYHHLATLSAQPYMNSLHDRVEDRLNQPDTAGTEDQDKAPDAFVEALKKVVYSDTQSEMSGLFPNSIFRSDPSLRNAFIGTPAREGEQGQVGIYENIKGDQREAEGAGPEVGRGRGAAQAGAGDAAAQWSGERPIEDSLWKSLKLKKIQLAMRKIVHPTNYTTGILGEDGRNSLSPELLEELQSLEEMSSKVGGVVNKFTQAADNNVVPTWTQEEHDLLFDPENGVFSRPYKDGRNVVGGTASPLIERRIAKFVVDKDKHLADIAAGRTPRRRRRTTSEGEVTPEEEPVSEEVQNANDEAVSEQENIPEAVSLSDLNTAHIDYHQTSQAGNPRAEPTYTKSKWDWHNGNETFSPGWEKVFLSRPIRTLALRKGLIEGEGVRDWNWTEEGKDIAAVLADMHKFYPKEENDNENYAKPDEGIIRSNMFEDILRYREEGRLPPNGFTNGQLLQEHTDRQPYRQAVNEAADRGEILDPVEQPDSQPLTPEDMADEDFDLDGFLEQLPHELNRGTGALQVPKDEDGNEYNPFSGGMEGVDLAEVFNRLKAIYKDMHMFDPENPDRPALLVHWPSKEGYFPATVPASSHNPRNIMYNKKEFTPEQVKEYNRLNTNKDITEQWLTRVADLFAPADPTTGQPRSMQWGDIWGRGQSWPSSPNQFVWHKTLDTLGHGIRRATEDDSPAIKHTIQINGEDVEVVSARDNDGQLNYASIPITGHGTANNFNTGRYTNAKEHIENFQGLFMLPNSQKIAKDALRNDSDVGPEWVRNNFKTAFEEWMAEGNVPNETAGAVRERREKVGHFLEWLKADYNNEPRHKQYTATEPPADQQDDDDDNEWSEPVEEAAEEAVEEPEVEDEVIPGAEDEVAEEGDWPNGNPRFDAAGNPLDEDGNIIEEEVSGDSDDDGVGDDDDGPGDDEDDEDGETEEQKQERMRARGAEDRAKRERRFPTAPPIVTSDDAALKDELINKIFRHEDKIGFGEREHRDGFKKDLEALELPDLQARWKDVLKEQASDRRNAAKTRGKEAAKAPEPEGLGGRRRKELIDQYVNSYREMHKQPMNPNWIKVLEGMSDSDLQKKHQHQLEEFDKHSQGESKKYRAYTGNNIDSSIPSLAPAAQQKHLTKDDILAQARRLVHHQFAYGDVMEKESKDILTARMAEVRQLAAAANMPLERLMQQDETEAEESGDYGSTAWLSRVGDAHVQTQTRRNGHKQTVNEQGSELRANRNYKPHIVATYGDDGNFMGFHDLRANAPIDEFNLGFDEDNHYHFHGLDPEKVKDYLRYKRLTSGETPRKIATMFDAPSPPDDPDLATLEAKVNGADYKDVRDRIDMHGNLPGAQELFRKKFGQSRKPVGPDGREENAPRFFMDDGDKVGTNGWYHPESESWINPYRYDYLRNSTEGQPGSGRAIPQGGDYYGRSRRNQRNAPDPRYAFALPTEAKKAKLRTGYGDQSYYIDDTGSIAHAHDSFENGNRQSHEAPQTVNGVVHDWYAQEMGNQMKANPQAFKDEQNNLRDVAEINAPQQPAVQAPPLQNMWLELEAVGGEPGSALERREAKKKSGWNWFDKKIAKPIKAIQHPASRQARNPLTSQQLGQDYSWSKFREGKQKWFDVIDWPQSQILSWAGRLLLPGITSERAEDKVIRRIRQGYKQQARTEAVLRETAGRLTINGQKLSDVYVAPGEQKARTEDYKELDDHIKHQSNYHRIQARQAKDNKDKAAETHHNAEWTRYQAAGNDLKPLDSKMPNHWERINNMYNHHLGKVQQAPPADEALQQWGGEMSQPDQEDWGVRMRQPEQAEQMQGATQPQKPIATMFDGSQDTGQSQEPQKPIATMFDKSLQKYLRSGYNKVGTL